MTQKFKNTTKGFILAGLLVLSGMVIVSKSKSTKQATDLSVSNIESSSYSTLKQDTSGISTSVPSSGLVQSKKDEPLTGNSIKRILKFNLNPDRTVTLIGEVNENALEAAAQITQLQQSSKEPIVLVLSGPGGSVLTGSILISAIEASQAPVFTICDVLCASMDSMIHQFGAKRFMTDRTVIMFHPASAGAQGDVDRMQSMVSFLQRFTNKLEVQVAKRQGISFEAYKAKTGVEFWIDAEDAVSQKVADAIVNYNVLTLPNFGETRKHEDKNNTKKASKQNSKAAGIDFQWICTTSFCKELTWTTLK